MASHRTQPRAQVQGVALIEQVIARVREEPDAIAGFCGERPLRQPRPISADVLERLTFPSGKALPPSLQRWLAFDASWLAELGWFSSVEPPVFTPRRLDEIVQAEFDMWGDFYEPLGGRLAECFLLPGGSDSRRIYAVTEEADALGEYPVLVVDTDDLPYAAVMYPGFDVFMADEAGLDTCISGTYEDLHDDPRYAARMAAHAHQLFNGKRGIEIGDEEWGGV
ncbi:MAG TPA: hypothetical protein VFU88_19950 [Ktedonobacterales bacterium]|nr:hypothetical protein [Ktedonobacterales bacterium]